MKLTAKVVSTDSATEYTDQQPRVKLRVAGADHMHDVLRLPNHAGFELDEELVVLVMRRTDAECAAHEISAVYEGQQLPYSSVTADLLDQLRPDPLPPWEVDDPALVADDAATTQEFKLGGTV